MTVYNVNSINPSVAMKRIKLLDNRLANQIAAGEVVERPSSVVKELMENCIDAGASKIEVEIERGGTRLIRVTDNGKGIHQDDLTLSLTRHATSKISSTSDLGCIQSLGFRGEALASISAVSKLSLTSRTHDSELAWQAIAHGRDMAVDVQPAAAVPGTRIEVADLFFNTPARQKFLRTEKTEFNHIEEIFNRHALANFAVTFILKHNSKIIKRVPACGEKSQYLNRISTICGKAFAENCVPFECQHESIQLFGWLGKPDFHRSESDIQYVYINGRPVKDKTLNHAIRQSYDGLLPAGRMATYVIFLNMDPAEVDVNVHPTKHEVRFGEQRLIHDLLAKSISESLSDCVAQTSDYTSQIEFTSQVIDDNPNAVSDEPATQLSVKPSERSGRFVSPVNYSSANSSPSSYSPGSYSPRSHSDRLSQTHFIKEHSNYSARFKQALSSKSVSSGAVSSEFMPSESRSLESSLDLNLIKLDENFWISIVEDKVLAIEGLILLSEFILKILRQQPAIKTKALLFPHQLSIDSELLEDHQFHSQLEKLGFVCEPIKKEAVVIDQLLIKKIPLWLACFENQWIFEKLPGWFENSNLSEELLASKISKSISSMPEGLMSLLIDEMKNDLLMSKSCKQLTAGSLRKLFV